MTAFWIAILAVFIALLPVMVKAARGNAAKKSDRTGEGGSVSACDSGSAADCSSDGGGGGCD